MAVYDCVCDCDENVIMYDMLLLCGVMWCGGGVLIVCVLCDDVW